MCCLRYDVEFRTKRRNINLGEIHFKYMIIINFKNFRSSYLKQYVNSQGFDKVIFTTKQISWFYNLSTSWKKIDIQLLQQQKNIYSNSILIFLSMKKYLVFHLIKKCKLNMEDREIYNQLSHLLGNVFQQR